jgi:Bacterial Ig-like domain (group 1)
MRKFAALIALFGLTLALAGCGGDSGCGALSGGTASTSSATSCSGQSTGTGTGTTTTTTVPGSLTVTTSAASIPADGSASATITVLAKDANNAALANVAVTLSASGGTLSGASGAVTSSTGTITATLAAGGVAAGQTITVTATSGSVVGKAQVSVVSTQQTITLITNSPTMPSNNSAPVTITAVLQNASNQLLPGIPVSFQASSGAIATVATTAGKAASPAVPTGTTDANGTAQATLSTPGNLQNRMITVTVSAGSATATIQVQVTGTKLAISGPTSLVMGAQGSYSVTLLDSGGVGISGQTVALTSANGNTLTPASVTTAATTGSATFALTAVNSGADTITATWMGVSATAGVTVSNQNFTFTAPSPTVAIVVGQSANVAFTWTSGGTGATGTVEFATSRGTLSTGSVSVSGGAVTPAGTTVSISSTTAGEAILQATALDGTGNVVATAQVILQFIATTPATVALQATPSTVAIQGTSTLTATVNDPTGNPVKGVTVDFSLQDPTGGTLSAASATTTAEGVASVTYTASTTSSPANGVIVTAQIPSSTVPSATTALTIGGQAVFLSLGTGTSITAYSTTQYILPYTVLAVDAAGNGVGNVNVTFSVQSVSYSMGQLTYVSGQWGLNAPTALDCPSTYVEEYNGVINPSPTPTGVTPVNTLIPGLVAATDVSSATTSSAGSASVDLIYPKDHALWVGVALTATATVQGSQNSTTASFILPGLAGDYTSPTTAPPGQFSPYGHASTCY